MPQFENPAAPEITIDSALCKICRACVFACPAGLFYQKEKGGIPQVVDRERCILCGQCLAICPYAAVTHSSFPAGKYTPIRKELLPGPESVIEMLRTRRSVRHFQNKPVEKELLEKIIEAARFAPTASNNQLNEYVVVSNPETINEIKKRFTTELKEMLEKLKNPATVSQNPNLKMLMASIPLPNLERILSRIENGYDALLRGAPAVILFHSDSNIGYSEANCNLALQNASLMVEALNLGAFYTGHLVSSCRRNRAIPNLLGIPEKNRVYAGLAIGYPRFKYVNWVERKPASVIWH